MDLEESYDYKTGERRLSPDGIPQWTLTLAMKPANARPSIAQVSIASSVRPDVDPGERPVFGGLQARFWQSNKGGRANSGVMFTADTVSTAVTDYADTAVAA